MVPTAQRAKPWALPESLQQRFGFQPGEHYPRPHDFEAEARHWKKMLYELRRTPEAREASKAIVDKLVSQRRPSALANSFHCLTRAGFVMLKRY